MSHEAEESKQVCREYLECLSKGDWSGANDLLADEFSAWFPQLGESFDKAETYIKKVMQAGKLGPYQINNMLCEYESWDRTYSISVQLCLLEKDGDRSSRNFKVLFFEVDSSGTIASISEFLCYQIIESA